MASRDLDGGFGKEVNAEVAQRHGRGSEEVKTRRDGRHGDAVNEAVSAC